MSDDDTAGIWDAKYGVVPDRLPIHEHLLRESALRNRIVFNVESLEGRVSPSSLVVAMPAAPPATVMAADDPLRPGAAPEGSKTGGLIILSPPPGANPVAGLCAMTPDDPR